MDFMVAVAVFTTVIFVGLGFRCLTVSSQQERKDITGVIIGLIIAIAAAMLASTIIRDLEVEHVTTRISLSLLRDLLWSLVVVADIAALIGLWYRSLLR